ncbi:conserved hypothetical protein, partial [Perkinsus marinus ATCC 50983]
DASDAQRALDFAVEHGAAASSHSFGGTYASRLLNTGFKNAAAAGHVALVAACNSRASLDDMAFYPCSYAQDSTSMLCVTASTSDATESS